MKMDRKQSYLQQDSLKSNPFGLPEGYFDSFPERLQQRIREEESSRVPVRRIGTTTRWLAAAAAVLATALITTSIIRLTNSDRGTDSRYPDMAILEQLQVFDDDRYLYDLIEDNDAVNLNEDDAFASQAIEYLAVNDVEMDLIFE